MYATLLMMVPWQVLLLQVMLQTAPELRWQVALCNIQALYDLRSTAILARLRRLPNFKLQPQLSPSAACLRPFRPPGADASLVTYIK
jgi:hypothetical protein